MIKDIVEKGEGPFSGVFIVADIQCRKTSDKRPFTVITFGDKTGRIKGYIWDKQLTYLKSGTFLKASGQVKFYNKELVLRLSEESIQPVKRPDSLDDFINSLDSLTINTLWEELLGTINSIQEPFYKKVLQTLLARHETLSSEFNLKNAPLSDEKYGAYCGALLEHIVYCCRHARTIFKNYFDRNVPIDPDLLLTIIILHDIGRIQAFENIMAIQQSTAGKLVGPAILSFNLTWEMAAEAGDSARQLKLAHGVLSTAKKNCQPQFLEAMLAKSLQEMDANVGLCSRAINYAKYGDEFVPMDCGGELYNG